MFELLDENNSDEIPVEIISKNQTNDLSNEFIQSNANKLTVIQLEELLEKEKQKVQDYKELLEKEKQKVQDLEGKIKYVLADFQNLNRKTQSSIEQGVNIKIDEFMLDFLKIYDDFLRAKQVFTDSKINTNGLDSILKNIDSLLIKYDVIPIEAIGEIFDPNFHEAISFIIDPELDNNTITKELRKGYISHKRVIRPTLVEISKKQG